MREVELKSVVDDLGERRARVQAAGGALVFEGRMEDRRYDTAARALAADDHVLRLRVYRTPDGARSHLDWKGPTRFENDFKVREELSTGVTDPDVLMAILDALGYVTTREIEREIAQYDLNGTMIRFEQYPRMDVLVEVEGSETGIERAIKTLGMRRDGFTVRRLPELVRAFEKRTGLRAALCQRELRGEYRYRPTDA